MNKNIQSLQNAIMQIRKELQEKRLHLHRQQCSLPMFIQWGEVSQTQALQLLESTKKDILNLEKKLTNLE